MNSQQIHFLFGALLIYMLQGAGNFRDDIPLSPSTTRPSVVLDDDWNSTFERGNRDVATPQITSLAYYDDSITWSSSLEPSQNYENH